MDAERRNRLALVREKIFRHFSEGIVPFWAERGIDTEFGGYLTSYDAGGNWIAEDTDKYIVTQTRLIWGFSLFHQRFPQDRRYLDDATQGVDFFIDHFWDQKWGGWFWKVRRDGSLIDPGKVVYGQSFAIYALSQYYLATGISAVSSMLIAPLICSSAIVLTPPAAGIMRTWNQIGPLRARLSCWRPQVAGYSHALAGVFHHLVPGVRVRCPPAAAGRSYSHPVEAYG
jgi:hypothetical protein